MKKIIIAGTLLLASISQADIIKCSFTEPFVDSTYSMTQSTLSYHSVAPEFNKVIKNVSFQIKSAGVFELKKDGKVLQTLTLSGKGSDGMSDNTYPYEVADSSMPQYANSGNGGCTSNNLKAKDTGY